MSFTVALDTGSHPASPVSAPVCAGVVGGGFMGAVHTRAIRAAGGVVLGLTTSTPGGSALAAARIGVPAAATVEDLLSNPDVSVIHICTPNVTHAALAIAALEAGKHVVCEKPLAVGVPGATHIQRVADERGLLVAVPFVYRFHPMVREAAARIRTGTLGEVHSVQSCYLQDWLSDPADTDWRVDHLQGGPSRAFADIGSHLCDLIEFMTGHRIAALSARTRTVVPVRSGAAVTTEDLVTLSFETDSGALGTALVSQVAAGRKNRLVVDVMGSEGSLAFDQEKPDTLWLGDQRDARTLPRDVRFLDGDAARLALVPVGHPMGYQDAFNNFVADAYAGTRGPLPVGLPTAADGVRASQIVEAVLSSAAEQGRWVALPESLPSLLASSPEHG